MYTDKKTTRKIKIYKTSSPEETFNLGMSFAKSVYPAQIIALNGQLGSGKTVFTKGLALGLGIKDIVNSPTFTILHEYYGGRIPLYHFDAYRIGSSDEMAEIGLNEFLFGNGVSVIEWAENINDMLPERITRIWICTTGEDFNLREIRVLDSF